MKLQLEKLIKNYDKTILDDLNLTINGVQAVGIIGASGCGKSTLLRLLAGIEFPDAGKIRINEVPINLKTVKSYQEKIGYVFQKHNLFPHLTIRENLLLILEKVKKMDKNQAEKRTDELLTQFQLNDQSDQKPYAVSGGQAQRASIARALSNNPSLILLDEPTAALDPLLTGEVLSAIHDLKNLGKDFIFVTHEISFLRNFADYVIFMDAGQIIEHGDIAHINNPTTEKLKQFLTFETKNQFIGE